jgi:hypothetical protein
MIFRYVPHRLVLDYARVGWHLADTFEDVYHGRYAVLMQWLCACSLVMPKDLPPPATGEAA